MVARAACSRRRSRGALRACTESRSSASAAAVRAGGSCSQTCSLRPVCERAPARVTIDRPATPPSPAAGATGSARAAAGEGAPASSNGSTKGATRRVEATRAQQLVARRMAEAKATIPEFQVQTDVAMDAAIAFRAELRTLLEDGAPSLNDLIVKACAIALRWHPRANASYSDGGFDEHERVNVGVAVAGEQTLVVPVVLDADKKALKQIARETRLLAERVRLGAISPPELSGATFTVSNLGMYGMTQIVPVINPPQAAILGVGDDSRGGRRCAPVEAAARSSSGS